MKKKYTKKRRNFVHKYMEVYCKASTEPDKKQLLKRGKIKHKKLNFNEEE